MKLTETRDIQKKNVETQILKLKLQSGKLKNYKNSNLI